MPKRKATSNTGRAGQGLHYLSEAASDELTIKELREKVAGLTRINLQLVRDKQDNNTSHEALMKRNDQLNTQLQAAEAAKEQIVEQKDAEIFNLQQQLRHLRQQHDTSKQIVEEQDAEISNLQQQLRHLRQAEEAKAAEKAKAAEEAKAAEKAKAKAAESARAFIIAKHRLRAIHLRHLLKKSGYKEKEYPVRSPKKKTFVRPKLRITRY